MSVLPRLLAALVTSLMGGLAAVGALYVCPFLAHLNPLKDAAPAPDVWAGFVCAAFVLGALLGLTPLIPWKAMRASAAVVCTAVAGFMMFVSAVGQSLSSLTSGDSLIVLILMSPIYLAVGVFYLLVVAAGFAGLTVGASLGCRALVKLPPPALGGGAAVLAIAAAFVVVPFARVQASAQPRPPAAAPTPSPVVDDCGDPPLARKLRDSSLRAHALLKDSATSTMTLYLVGLPEWTGDQVAMEAVTRLEHHLECREDERVWTIKTRLAQPLPVTLSLTVKPERGMTRKNQEMMVRSNVRSSFESGIYGRDDDGRFVTSIGSGAVSYQLAGCEPADQLTCEGDRIRLKQPGFYPQLVEMKLHR